MGITWKSISGSLYEFNEHPYESEWTEAGGVYVFAARLPNGDWNPLYIGNADSLARRIQVNEKWPWAVRLGANGVLACGIPEAAKRVKIVAEMIGRLKPPLNDCPQSKPDETLALRQVGGRRTS